MKNIFILLFILQVLPFNEAYNLSCPSQAHWTLRAKSMCVFPECYTCLYNVTFQANVYSEICSTPNIINSGYKLVFQPHPNNATCRENRFQPFIFDSIGYSKCAFRKSLCNGEGQTTYGNGNSTSDRTCSCNTNQGYTFVENLKNPCHCNPSTEDCSCYISIHSKNKTTGLKDFNYEGEINILQSRSQGRAFNKSQILQNDDFDNIKYNLAGPTNEYRNKAAACVLILKLLFLLIISIYIHIVQRIIEQWIDAPGNFEVVEVSDVSITVEWDNNNTENLHKYELVLRRQGSNGWENIIVSTKDILTKDNGRCVFKFQDLFPETCYEMKMCFLHDNVKGQFTQSKTQKTLQIAPGNFEVVEVSDVSITVEWDKNNTKNLHEYELVLRRQGSDDWGNIIVSTKDILTKDNGRCLFKFQDLCPETCYEMKMCFLHDNVKGQYTETKTQTTLQIAPENFEVVEVSAVSITVEWDIYNTENLIEYKLDHRPQGSDDWKEIILSTNDIPINEKRRYMYKHQDLFPGTYYEIRMCSIHDNVKSQSTKPTTRQTLQIDVPAGIKGLSEEDRNKYVKLTTSSETEKRHFVRIMFVGKESVGKTCLVKRLLGESIVDEPPSTDGVDIIIRRCKINIENGEWIIDQDISYDKEERLFRALNKHKTEKKRKSNFEDMKLPNSDSLKHAKYISPEGKRVDIEQKAPTVEDSNLPTIKNNDNNMTMANPPKSEYRNEERTSKDVHPINSPEHTESLENADNASRMRRGENDSMLTRADTNIKSEDTNINSEEIEDDEKLSSLVMPPNLMSDILSNTLSRQSSTKCQYASCGLWDFAGQLEFYATHQAFLTSSAIYILVSSMDDEIEKQDVKQCFAEYKKLGEYVDFWFDNIHCHRTKNEPLNDELEPPVILVFTGKDRHEKAEQETRKQALNKQLFKVIGNQTKYRHYKRTFYLSNMEDSDDEFEVLRKKISEIAQKMGNWGESMPLKWILLEHLIEINKDNGKNFITLNDMIKIAKHPDIAIFDIDEVSLFLRFQCKVGNIIYFEDITSLIILNPQWLSNAFRCLVSDKLDIDDVENNVQVRLDWNDLQEKGKISILLITTLFKLKGGTQFEQQMDDLIKVMKRFDILVEIEDTDSYMMPSMMPISSFETVCNDIGIFDRNCQRSSWFCLKFSFLPPAFFNHLSAWLMKTYKPSTMKDDSEALALYRGICVFNYDRSGCDKLLMTMSTDTIALQVVSFANTGIQELGNLCTEVRKGLIRKINVIKKRYKLNISYEQRFKCGDGHYHINSLSFEDLKREKYIYCLQHKKVHECRGIYLPWTMDIVEFTEEEISYLRIVALLHVAEDAVRLVFDYEFHPDVLYKEVNKVKHIIRKYLNKSQWETLCNTRDGKGKVSSRKFDLHLMLCFFKNTIYPSIGADYGRWNWNITLGPLSNIWHYRIQMSQNVNGQLAKNYFIDYWRIILQAITMLEQRYGYNSLILKCSRIENCDLDDTSEILQTETNYLRILHFILHVAREVFKEYFDREFLPSTLRHTIRSNERMLQKLQKEQRLITSYQLQLLFSIKVKSDLLDIRTMAMLMVHLNNIEISNRLPIDDSNTDYRVDLSRILWYSRQVMHCEKFTMDEFDDLWNKISEAVQRLGGARYTALCKQLKTSPLHASEP